jgi:putative ABC transport system permease protein
VGAVPVLTRWRVSQRRDSPCASTGDAGRALRRRWPCCPSLLARAVHEVDLAVRIKEAMTLSAHVGWAELKEIRVIAFVASYGAVLAVLLVGIRIYGTLAFCVGRRTKEIVPRVVIGASPREVLRMIVDEEMAVVLVGVLVGVARGWGASRFVRHLLYGNGATDAALYAAAAMFVTAVSLFSSWLPARRAARLDPMVALKVD